MKGWREEYIGNRGGSEQGYGNRGAAAASAAMLATCNMIMVEGLRARKLDAPKKERRVHRERVQMRARTIVAGLVEGVPMQPVIIGVERPPSTLRSSSCSYGPSKPPSRLHTASSNAVSYANLLC